METQTQSAPVMTQTPGPWKVDRDNTGPGVYCADWETRIADVCGDNLANARLIAAAPEMLEALHTALRHAREAMPANERAEFDAGRGGSSWMFSVRDAIAKAEAR